MVRSLGQLQEVQNSIRLELETHAEDLVSLQRNKVDADLWTSEECCHAHRAVVMSSCSAMLTGRGALTIFMLPKLNTL